MTGAVTDTLSNTNVFLYRFDENGDSLWFKQFDLNATDVGYQCIQDDSCFVIVGQRISSNSNLMVLKTDTLGNYIWHNTFGGAITEIGFSVTSSPNGGYMLGGYSNSWTNDIDDYDTYIVKIDSVGSFEWEKTYGDSVFDCPAFIKQTSDGNYVIATCIGTQVLAGYSQAKSRVIKIDPIGDIIWDSNFGEARRTAELYNIHELSDGSFITGGTRSDTLGSPAPYNGWAEGIVIKLDENGNQIWYRVHEYFTSLNANNYFRDVTSTSDGGFISCGNVYPGTSGTGSQDFWVVKMDAEGYATDIESTASENSSMSIYPNPTSGTFTVKLRETTPNHFINLYNQLGEKIKEIKVVSELTTVNVSDMSSGIYFVQIIDGTTVIGSQKVVVSR
jgi:hypothetical protein